MKKTEPVVYWVRIVLEVSALLQELEILNVDNQLKPKFMNGDDEAQITFLKSAQKHEIDLKDVNTLSLIDFSARWVLIAKFNNTFETYQQDFFKTLLRSGFDRSPRSRAPLEILEDLPESDPEGLPVFVAGQVLAGDVLCKYLDLVKLRNCTVSASSS